MIEPIRPHEIEPAKAAAFPDEVVTCWNRLLVSKWDGRKAHIPQKEAVAALMEATKLPRADIFEKRFLDIEPMFREAGWRVYYDKPAYFEEYDPFFVFQLPKK